MQICSAADHIDPLQLEQVKDIKIVTSRNALISGDTYVIGSILQVV